MIKFKSRKLEEDLIVVKNINRPLYNILMDLEKHLKTITVTSIYRPNDIGVHRFWRGIDVRAKNLKDKAIKKADEYINSLYVYDPTRPNFKVLLVHGEGDNIHFHLQNCKATCKTVL